MMPSCRLIFSRNVITVLLSLCISVSLAGGQQSPPLQLNTPYHCGNNIIVVVRHCEMRNGTEMCSLVKGPVNGPLGDEISMPKAQAAAIGLICPPGAAGTAQTVGKGTSNGKSFNP